MKLNIPELIHYLLGGVILLALWLPLMDFFNEDVYLTSGAWLLAYIIVDQIMHVVIKKEKISIVKVR